jgi:hypothetical protein
MFNQLVFEPHEIANAIQATYTFSNGWMISVVSGPGLYGRIEDNTYEVAIFRPNGNMTDDVKGWNSEAEVSAMMWVLSQL